MAALLTLADVKLHCRIDTNDEDALLGALITASTTAVANELGVTSGRHRRAPIKAAALLLVGDLYENREAQTDRQLFRNQAFDRLLAPYRVYA